MGGFILGCRKSYFVALKGTEKVDAVDDGRVEVGALEGSQAVTFPAATR
jgi:hypothetical protein